MGPTHGARGPAVTTAVRVVPLGDAAVVVQFEEVIDPRVNARAIRLADLIRAERIEGVRDVVPTFRSVAVYFDPLRTRATSLMTWLQQAVAHVGDAPLQEGTVIQVPVCYGEDLGPDLQAVARFADLSPDEVVALHAGAIYRVFMLGFMPGFPYLGRLDPRLAVPRRATPRLRVPAGSVGIAGWQTGIYPAETPGGWQLIGRTPVRPFDLARSSPFLFQAGDRVQFVPIVRSEFERVSGAATGRVES